MVVAPACRTAQNDTVSGDDDNGERANPTQGWVARGDPRVDAIGAFERWSNYLPITTVAATGWAVTHNARFRHPLVLEFSIWSLALSAVFAMLTLAVIPMLTEHIRDKTNHSTTCGSECGSLACGQRSMCPDSANRSTSLSSLGLFSIAPQRSPLYYLHAFVLAVLGLLCITRVRSPWRQHPRR